MSILPRLAVGTIQPEVDSQPIVWGLLDCFAQAGLRTQTFFSRACFRPHDGASIISGIAPRHLDSWLMTPTVCRQSFLQAAASADLALVEGRYDQCGAGFKPASGLRSCSSVSPRLGSADSTLGGSLDTLCEWLDLPRIGIVDVRRLSHCQLPKRPAVDRLLLDRVSGACDFHRWQTILESLWGIPVVGGLEECAALRQQIARLPAGQKPQREWASTLANELARYCDSQRLLRLAERPGIPGDWSQASVDESGAIERGNVHVAVAYDEAFNCYFRDTLDMLELRGATVRVFSPLRDECLPPGTDIVYIGCGAPHEHAEALAENHCMLMALKEHVCSGRRIYAEGGGLAYLCQSVETADGRRTEMVGALRANARRNPMRVGPTPVEVTLAVDSWLGASGSKLRGYRNGNWTLEATGCLTRFVKEPDSQLDLVGRHQAIGSRLHLNFAAQPALLAGFLRPCPAALAWAGK
jgi:cobyrinic acid a,c-diamide synthase